MDIRDSAACAAAVDRVAERCERIDILVNNAGAIRDNQLAAFDDEDVRLVLDTNVGGAFNNVNGVKDKGIALRGLFIINPEGILQYSVVHDLNIGRSVDETLRVLQGLRIQRAHPPVLGPRGPSPLNVAIVSLGGCNKGATANNRAANNSTASAPAAITVQPMAKPSRPSVRFTALLAPTITR